jgi:hypothetical protein
MKITVQMNDHSLKGNKDGTKMNQHSFLDKYSFIYSKSEIVKCCFGKKEQVYEKSKETLC